MTSLNHAIEVGLLNLAAYLVGCVIGYVGHRLTRRIARSRDVGESPKHPSIVAPVEQSAAVQPLSPPSVSPSRRLAGAGIAEPAPVMTSATPRRPPQFAAPKGAPDDLKKIKGIGKKTESALHDLGIYHFAQIAAWERVHVDWLEGRIAIKGRIVREQWVEQATLLMTARAD